jgi:radical SAM superfamily enzyme YgiQ (UPF0313 family)
MGSNDLKLNEFKELYKALTRGMPPWFSFLVLGFLVWVEEKFIDIRIKTEVDEAIKEYETLHSPPEVVIPPPVYSETGSDFFDEMRLTAPWVDREHPSDSP